MISLITQILLTITSVTSKRLSEIESFVIIGILYLNYDVVGSINKRLNRNETPNLYELTGKLWSKLSICFLSLFLIYSLFLFFDNFNPNKVIIRAFYESGNYTAGLIPARARKFSTFLSSSIR